MKHLFFSIAALTSLTMPLAAQDIPLSKILVEKEGWREVANMIVGVKYIEAESTGNVAIYRGGAQSILLGADGKLDRVPQDRTDSKNQQVANSLAGASYRIETEIKGFPSGPIPFGIELPGGIVVVRKSNAFRPLKVPTIVEPTCLTLWPDEGHLVIGEADGAYLWAVRIEKYGSFGPGDRYYSLRTRPNEKMHVTAMTMDAGYLLYACTPLGIQVFDPTGRLSGVIASPAKEPMTAITIGGAKADELFVAAGERIFARKIQGKASYTLKKDK